jgi:hypothetical protein
MTSTRNASRAGARNSIGTGLIRARLVGGRLSSDSVSYHLVDCPSFAEVPKTRVRSGTVCEGWHPFNLSDGRSAGWLCWLGLRGISTQLDERISVYLSTQIARR